MHLDLTAYFDYNISLFIIFTVNMFMCTVCSYESFGRTVGRKVSLFYSVYFPQIVLVPGSISSYDCFCDWTDSNTSGLFGTNPYSQRLPSRKLDRYQGTKIRRDLS